VVTQPSSKAFMVALSPMTCLSTRFLRVQASTHVWECAFAPRVSTNQCHTTCAVPHTLRRSSWVAPTPTPRCGQRGPAECWRRGGGCYLELLPRHSWYHPTAFSSDLLELRAAPYGIVYPEQDLLGLQLCSFVTAPLCQTRSRW